MAVISYLQYGLALPRRETRTTYCVVFPGASGLHRAPGDGDDVRGIERLLARGVGKERCLGKAEREKIKAAKGLQCGVFVAGGRGDR